MATQPPTSITAAQTKYVPDDALTGAFGDEIDDSLEYEAICKEEKQDKGKTKVVLIFDENSDFDEPRAPFMQGGYYRLGIKRGADAASLSSWCTVDGNFDYEGFWNNIVNFFKDVPGPVVQCRVAKLLEWWTRKIFGTSHRQDLTPEVISRMSVTALAEQRKVLEDAAFDSE
ncbi:hypothetical protein EV702DRAFT_1191325 [Suillus placidus]|uniref:Uncharacterized protein n=1 Tax=Suillus placidus TaxID=48579 RepID=A0A9P7A5I4_9AGAM|nr:hypothetical protein EV702DRAFT_1191325 [Suillus placidus]